VIHLFSIGAWTRPDTDNDGGPLDRDASRTLAAGERPKSIIQRIVHENPRCDLPAVVRWFRRSQPHLDIASRAMRSRWTVNDPDDIAKHFQDRLVARVRFYQRSADRPPRFEIYQLAVVTGVVASTPVAGEVTNISLSFDEVRTVVDPFAAVTGSVGLRLIVGADSVSTSSAILGDRCSWDDHGNRQAVRTNVELVDGGPGQCEACHLWRVDVDSAGNVFLLVDMVIPSERVRCITTRDLHMMDCARMAREEHAGHANAPGRGQAKSSTSAMVLQSVERRLSLLQPKWTVSGDQLTSGLCAARVAFLLNVALGDKWSDRDRSASWAPFVPWKDMHHKDLGLSLLEQDFVRRLATDHFQRFPRGYDQCPCCGGSADLTGGPRHLVFACPKAVLLRDALIASSQHITDPHLVNQAWVWRLRPGTASAAQPHRRLTAIRLVVRAQIAFRRAIWSKFGDVTDIPIADRPTWFSTVAEEQEFVCSLVFPVAAALPL
jgi:hypothetical protein